MAIDPVNIEAFQLFASFHEPDDLVTSIPPGIYLEPIEVTARRVKNAPGDGSASFSMTTPPNTNWATFAVADRVCNVWAKLGLPGGAIKLVPITAFLVEGIDIADDLTTFSINGPSLLDEWRTAEPLFDPIGVFKSDLTTLAETAPGPWNTTLSVAALIAAKTITVASASEIIEGDELRITLNSGTIHVTTASTVEGNVITLGHQLPGPAALGKQVQRRRAKIRVADTSLFYAADIIFITRDTPVGGIYTASYEIASIGEEDDAGWIFLTTGLVAQSSTGKTVQRVDYSEPTANDVATVISALPPWTYTMQSGRTSKTSLATKGTPPLAVLAEIAKIHGEYFYELQQVVGVPGSTMVAQRKIDWRYECKIREAIHLIEPTSDAHRNEILDDNYGIILNLKRSYEQRPINKIYVKGAGAGGSRITLADCSATAISEAAAEGFEIEGYEGSIRIPYSITLIESRDLLGPHVTQVNIDIPPESMSPEAVTSAADMMLKQACNWLRKNAWNKIFFVVTCQYSEYAINPGDIIYITSQAMTAQPFQVLSVEVSANNEQGITSTLEIVSDFSPGIEETGTSETTAAAEIIQFQRAREMFQGDAAEGSSRGGGKVVVEGSTPNLTAGYGISVSGSTISVVPSQLIENGIQLISNKFAVNTTVLAGSGLTGASNMFAVNATGGIQVLSDYIRLLLASASGLEITGNQELRLGTPIGLNSTSINAVSGIGHSHAITAYSDQNVNPGTLVKSSSVGELITRTLQATTHLKSPLLQADGALGISAGGAITQTAVGAWTANATAESTFNLNQARLNLNGSLRFTSAVPVLDTGTGTPLTIAPQGLLNLNPSGDTVYQWNVNSEFRSSDYLSQLTGWSLTGATDQR